MAETVIFPLSDETGRSILAMLRRIAVALETMAGIDSQDGATYDDGDLVISGGAEVDEDGILDTTATVEDGYLTF